MYKRLKFGTGARAITSPSSIRLRGWFVVLLVGLLTLAGPLCGLSGHREAGYLYLSPTPDAEFVLRETRFILARFAGISPSEVTNLSTFMRVTGERSGPKSGTTWIAGDERTVVFEVSTPFHSHERITVFLNPQTTPEFSDKVQPYRYEFMTCGRMPPPPQLSASGETPVAGVKENAVDLDPRTSWSAPVTPGGETPTWVQLLYPSNTTRVLGSYSLSSAHGASDNDPADWRFYGVDGSSALVLLDSQTGQVFSTRSERRTFAIENRRAFRGYRLEISQARGPEADSVEMSELELHERNGSALWECWTGVPGAYVSDLTNHTRFPADPDLRGHLTSFEAPTEWTNNYGTRVRALLTAPATGEFRFWISSDDTSELWLGTDSDPASRRRIAFLNEWTYPRQWVKLYFQKSAPIMLTAGETYYIEALHKENLSNDSLAVGWSKPGEDTAFPSEVIPGAVLTAWQDDPSAVQEPRRAQVLSSGARKTSLGPREGTRPEHRKAAAKIMSNGVSVPSDFPQAIITVNRNPAPGYLFLDGGAPGAKYTMMLDTNGAPVWYRRGQGRDFRLQPNGMITWGAPFEGTTTPYVGVNTNFQLVRDYVAVNGFRTDEHELRVLPDGGYLLIGAQGEYADLSSYFPGSWNNVYVYQTVVQEFTAAGELIFQFCPWDHFSPADVDPRIEPRGFGMRFPHINAIEVDTDGHLLISSRHMNEVTKIERDTGEVIWRLGGAHSDFTFVDDPLNDFSAQHDISVVGTNRYLLFDNGNTHQPPVSRAVEYDLDLTSKTARLVWQYRDVPDKYAHFMGNAQRLPNGHTLINFVLGSYPKAIEVDRAGVKQYELNLTPSSDLYRVFRFPWDGVVPAPYLLVEEEIDSVALIFNKFGDASVDYYRVYAGLYPGPTNLVATSKGTLYRLRDVTNGVRNHFRVTAVSTNGVESAWSNEESLVVNIIRPGENLLSNGEFALGQSGWTLLLGGSAAAELQVAEGTATLQVSNPGTYPDEIQLFQGGVQLLEGREYVLEFDAWAAQPRVLEANVLQTAASGLNYSQNPPSMITPVRTRFHYAFVMRSPSDREATLVFNAGTSAARLTLDNVALVLSPSAKGDLTGDGRVDFLDLKKFAGDWLGSKAGLEGDLNGDGRVDFNDFALLARDWTLQQEAPEGVTPPP